MRRHGAVIVTVALFAAGEAYLPCRPACAVTQEWSAHYLNGNKKLAVMDIEADSSGDVYITGADPGPISADPAIVTIKYDGETGDKVWEAWYEGMGWTSRPSDLMIGYKGTVFVTGFTETEPGGNKDFVTIAYDKYGNELWSSTYNGPGDDEDEAVAIARDRQGNIYVTGFSVGESTGYDYATVKYSFKDGIPLWEHRYDVSGNCDEEPVDIAVDRYGNVYVTGDSRFDATHRHYVTMKYGATGSWKWGYRYWWQGYEQARALAVDRYFNVFITGVSTFPFADHRIITVKYSQY